MDEAAARQLILDTLAKMDQMEELRKKQTETIAELRRALSHKYFWPEAYAGRAVPKILFVGAGKSDKFTMTMTDLETLEMRSFTFRVRHTTKEQSQFILTGRVGGYARIELVEPQGLEIPVDIMLEVVKPWLNQCF